ncbi:MAG: hypothetical protein R3B70_42110 [Polyangiaceae bacterium]
MARPKGRPKKDDAKKTAVQVRLAPELSAALDDLVAEYQAASPAAEVSRASVLRHLLEREIEARLALRSGKRRRA